jgi:hypothetical protein
MARGDLSLSFGLTLVMSLSLAQSGCDRLDEIIDDIKGGGAGGTARACASTAECPSGTTCTTEAGVCNPPPGCNADAGTVCPAVCYGTCARSGGGVACGKAQCAAGQVCCNASCGICTPPGGVCTQQLCDETACRADSDCRLFSDYCTGCDCRALGVGAPDPTCPGPGVQCLIDPCDNKRAVCARGACAVSDR